MSYKYTKAITINGRRHWIRANSKAELTRKVDAKIRESDRAAGIFPGDMTLKEWAGICTETYKTGQGPRTRKTFNYRVEHCILRHIGNMKLIDIKPLHCQQVLNLQQGNSRTQINEVYQAFRFFFKYAVANELVDKDPTLGLVKPAYVKHHRRALTRAEREAFIAVGKTDRRYYYFLLMLFCGCRPSEASECKGSDIFIRDSIPLLHIRGTKTQNADRLVPIPGELYELIKDTPLTEYIACYSTGAQIKEDNRRRVWHSYCRQLNIYMGCKTYRNALLPPYPLAPDLVPYCLRHEYCTELARRHVDIRIAQKLMGHSDIKLTANVYTNLDQDDVLLAAQLLGATAQK